jgi:predicted Zn-dependent peptidase
VPNVLHADGPALTVISQILTSGRTGRLFKNLVQEQQVAANANSGYGTTKYPTLFRLSGAPRNPKTLEELEKALLAEVDKLKKEPVSEDELQKVRNQIDANFSRSLENNAGLAGALGTGQVVLGDWHQIIKLNEKRRAVTASDIQRVAQKYFNSDNLTVAFLIGEGGGNRPSRRGGNSQGMEK